MRGSGGKLCFSEEERGKVRDAYMERIMNEENDWDHNAEMMIDEIKTGKAPGPTAVSMELISASRGIQNKSHG